MFTIYLEHPRRTAKVQRIGPVHGVRINRRSLRLHPNSEEIVRLRGNQWLHGGVTFDALVIPSPALIYVERSRRDKGRFYGPFDCLRVTHGAVFTSWKARMALGWFNVLDDALCVELDQSIWPTIMFFSCTYLDEPAMDEFEGFARL